MSVKTVKTKSFAGGQMTQFELHKAMRSLKAGVVPPWFLKAMAEQQNWVAEKLQLGGEKPDITPRSAISSDWQHVLTESLSDIFQQCRFTTGPENDNGAVTRAIKKRLALHATICMAWAKQLQSGRGQ